MKKSDIVLKENLKMLLTSKNMRLSQVSRFTNINKTTLHNYLHGVYPQGLLTVIKLAQFFNVPLEELVLGNKSSFIPNSIKITEGQYEITIKRIKE